MKTPIQPKQVVLFLFVLGSLLLGGRQAWADEIALTQIVQAGETVVFTMELRNESAVDHIYAPAFTGLPDAVSVTFNTGGANLEKLTIPASGAGLIYARVNTAVTTLVGSYPGEFTATRDDGETVRLPITLIVENTYALEIVNQSVTLSTFSGQTFTFDVSATNTGAETVNNVALQVSTPAKWIVKTEPPQVDTLEPGGDVAFHVQVVVPPSQVAIDQPVTLLVVADEVSSPEGKLIVRVQKSPNYLLAAGGIIAATVAGVFVYFRANGRR
jgi:uncharacterized membrane protein